MSRLFAIEVILYKIVVLMSKRNIKRKRRVGGLQVVTLCISTSLVLILLGIVIFTVMTARNLSNYVKENLTVTVMLNEKVTMQESVKLCNELNTRPYTSKTTYISPKQALDEHIKSMGADPTEFLGGNPFVGSIEMQLQADYANSDSLVWITKELKRNVKVTDVAYQKDLMDMVNTNLKRVSMVLLVLAALLTFISFALINNTVRLSVFARRFSIHTMKLVGASWAFIRWPFIRRALFEGLLSAVVADGILAGGLYALYMFEPQIALIVDWKVAAVTAGSVLLLGLFITTFCSYSSVNKFLRMKAGDLYKV